MIRKPKYIKGIALFSKAFANTGEMVGGDVLKIGSKSLKDSKDKIPVYYLKIIQTDYVKLNNKKNPYLSGEKGFPEGDMVPKEEALKIAAKKRIEKTEKLMQILQAQIGWHLTRIREMLSL